MTIKRRIFLSNILMIVLTMLIGGVVFLVARSVMVDDYMQTRGGGGGRFTDFTHIPVVGVSETHEAFERGNFAYAATVYLYHSDLGDFIVILSDSHVEAIEDFLSVPNFVVPAIVVYLLIVVFLGNVLIAKYITRRIMIPINTLVDGVHEISNGNLTHRIQYKKGDEFDAICSDFNEMASRLSDMVEQRQADENSRKELIAGISHDLRTPLTSVKAYLEGLRKGIAKTPEMQEKYLNTIQAKTDDIEYIIKQLFMFSKIDIGEFPLNLETVDIGNELTGMVDGFADEYKEMGLEVSLEENTNGDVLIDTVQFKNIVQNILGNSVKYCNRNDACSKIFCKSIDGNVSITIKDNGPGVPVEMLTKMFEVFYRGDESRNNPDKGSGLGLAISSKIIERLNGSIKAENATDGGLAIIITLPIQKGGAST